MSEGEKKEGKRRRKQNKIGGEAEGGTHLSCSVSGQAPSSEKKSYTVIMNTIKM